MDLKIKVLNQKIHYAATYGRIVEGSQNFVRFVFDMTSEWDDLKVFAQFTQNGTSYNVYLDDENAVYLPTEITAGTCALMLYGTGDTTIGTTNTLKLAIDPCSLVTDVSSTELTESLYTQLINQINALGDEVDMLMNMDGEALTEFVAKLVKDTDAFSELIEDTTKETLATYLEEGKLEYHYLVVDELPEEGDATQDYFLSNGDGTYTHYRYINGAYHIIGASNVYNKDEIDSMISEIQSDIEMLETGVVDVSANSAEDALIIKYYDGETKEIKIDTGTTIDSWYQDEDGYLHLYDVNGEDIVDPIQISGGGSGSASTGSAVITRITPVNANCVYGSSFNIEYNLKAIDSAGDEVGNGTGTWYVGGVIKATSTVYQGDNSFDIGEYLSAGSNTVKLSVTIDTGGDSYTVITKTWTITTVNMYFTWTYDDSQINTSAFTDRWTPYGDVSKTTYTYIDDVLIDENTTSRSGVAQSVTIPMQTHGSHMVKRYMSAIVDSQEIYTDYQYHDMIFVESGNSDVIIASTFMDSTMTQYNTVQIPIIIYDPNNITADAVLAVDGEEVATWTGVDRTTHYWNYSPAEYGTKTLTITSGGTTKTIVIEVEELDIDIAEVTGYDFRFKASDFATNDAVQAWASDDGETTITFSDNFDWTNGGLQTETDDSGNIRQFFCVKAGTTATINYKLFADDAKSAGKSFKFIYKAVNCRDYDAQVLSCMDSGIGLLMQAQSATLKTEQNTLETITCKDDYIEFEFNIHPTSDYRYLSFIMDGCYDRLCLYAQNDNMTQTNKQYITIGSDDCDVYVYMVKAYPTYMTDENICDNFIMDAPNAFEMADRYSRNNILNASGEVSPELLYTQNPDCRVFLVTVPRMTTGKKDTVTGCSVRQVYQSGGTMHCWNATNVSIKGQGTSSENYGDSARNMDFKFNDGFIFDDGSTASEYSMTDNSIGINYMNFKLNVASSENCNNACIADWYNTFQPYLSAARTNNSNARDTMEFHPCAVFIADESGDLFGDKDYHLYGIGDCGNSKKNTAVFHDLTNKKECCIEVSNNTNEQCLMHSADFSNEEWDGSTSFEFRYVWEDDNDAEETANVLAEAKQAWIDFVTWMCEHDPNAYTGEKLDEPVTFGNYIFKGAGTDNEVLAGTTISTYAGTYEYDTYEYRMAYMLEHCEEHMIMDSIVYHFVFIESMGMIDNVVKNTFWSTNDLVHWSLEKDYDNDTGLGNDNEGGMTIPYGTETDDEKGSGHAFNGYDAVWITFVRGIYDARATMYINRESAGCWNTEAFLTKLSNYQDTRPERLWVADCHKKYLNPYETSGTESYIDMLAGKKTHQRRQFKFYNEYYFSSCYVGSTCTSQLVTVRAYTPSNWAGVEPQNYIDLTMYADCYIVVKAASTVKRVRAKRGETYTVTFDEAGTLNDTETYFYLAPMIQKIGDMAHLYIGYCNFAYATLLQEISIGSDAEGYSNENLTSVNFNSSTMLEYLQIQNCPNTTSSLELTNCQRLQTLLLEGSGFTGISVATGGLLETAHLPSPASITFRELYYLNDFTMESYDNLSTIRVEYCPTIDTLAMVQSTSKLARVRLLDVSWELDSVDTLESLLLIAGLDESDANTDMSVLTGIAYVLGTIHNAQLVSYNTAWPNLTIDYSKGYMVPFYTLTYKNYDGTTLYTYTAEEGETSIDPVAEGLIEAPTRDTTTTYRYTYAGFSNVGITITSDLTLTAQYTAAAIYLMTYVDWDGTTLYTYYADSGSYPINPVTEGLIATPTRAMDDTYRYTFSGFSNMSSAVSAARTMTAQYTASELGCVVNWYDYEGGTLLDSTEVTMYNEAVYSGEIPTDTSGEEDGIYKIFKGWDKSTGSVEEDMNVYATWSTCTTPPEGMNISDMSAVQLYALTRINNMADADNSIFDNYAEQKDRIVIPMGNDYTFSNVEEVTIVPYGGDYWVDGTEDTVFIPKDDDGNEIKLLESDGAAFTIMIDFEFTDVSYSGCLLSCYDSNASKGIKLYFYPSTYPRIMCGSSTANVGYTRYRNVLVMRKKKSSNYIYYYTFNGTATTTLSDTLSTGTVSNTTTLVNDAPIVIGAQYNTSTGEFDSVGKGVIHFCKVWKDDLGATMCSELAAWYRDDWPMEYCGTARYTVADTGTDIYKSNASFISAKLFHQYHKMNSSSINYGGWMYSGMRKMLNPSHDYIDEDGESASYTGYGRFYNGIPIEWRSLIKKVLIPANSGYPQSSNTSYYVSEEVSILNSADYIYLPSYIEVYPTTADVYSEEGDYTSWLQDTSYRPRVRFLGNCIGADATEWSGSTEPVSAGNSPKLWDTWTSSTYTYLYVDKEFVDKYNLANTTSTPTHLSKYTSVGDSGILDDGGAWLSSYDYWWLRSAYYSGSSYFRCVNSNGAANGYNSANFSLGVLPGFSI